VLYIKITDKAKSFLLPCNNKRIRIFAIVEEKYKELVKHNSRNNKHYEHSILLKDVKAEINDKIGFIKKEIIIDYNYETSNFSYMHKGDNIEFYIRIEIENNNLYMERPSKIKKII